MNWILILLSAITFVSTLIGGLITLKYKKHLPYFFAFAAGSLLAVAFLDILPESIVLSKEAGIPIRTIMLTIVLAFFAYSLLERFFPSHEFDEHHDSHHGHGHIMGPIGASSLIVHSFFDGAAIGAAFQVSLVTGLIVAMAVIFHDFTDGINTVTVMLKNKQKVAKATLFLVIDALAPILGVVLTSSIRFSQGVLAILLAVFVGEFIYIGVASLLPETYHFKSKKIILAMAAGIVLIAVLTHFL